MPRLAAAKKDLQGFGSRNLHIAAEMRLSMYFAVGRTFPTWVAGSRRRNRGVLWSTIAEREDAAVEVLCDEDLDLGGDLALAIGLTHDPTSQVRDYITGAGLPVAKLLTLSTPWEVPRPRRFPGGWAADWVRHAREARPRGGREVTSAPGAPVPGRTGGCGAVPRARLEPDAGHDGLRPRRVRRLRPDDDVPRVTLSRELRSPRQHESRSTVVRHFAATSRLSHIAGPAPRSSLGCQALATSARCFLASRSRCLDSPTLSRFSGGVVGARPRSRYRRGWRPGLNPGCQ